MDTKKDTEPNISDDKEARREFMKKVGKASACAPAVALLLAASAKSASAGVPPSGQCGSGSS